MRRYFFLILVISLFFLPGCRGLRVIGNDLNGSTNFSYAGKVSNSPVTQKAKIVFQTPYKTVSCSGTLEPPASYGAANCIDAAGLGSMTCRDGRFAKVKWWAYTCEQGVGLAVFSDGKDAYFTYGIAAGPERTAAIDTVAERWKTEESTIEKPRELAKKEEKKEPEPLDTANGNGTGFFVSDDGLLITNYHVVEKARRVAVWDSFSGKTHEARVLLTDTHNDLAVLKIAAKSRALPLSSNSEVQKGQEVMALGYPVISLQGIEQKATFGRINSLTGLGNDVRAFQMDVPIQPGNSGGPLLNNKGEVVGVNTYGISLKASLKYAKDIIQNANYAIKVDYVKFLLTSLPEQPKLAPRGPKATKNMVDLVKQCERSVVLVLVWNKKK